MQRQTAADALIDAGREVATAIGSGSDRSASTGAGDPVGTLVVGTLLVLAVATAPILVVALVGYVVTAARDPDSPVSGFDDWIAITAAGARGTVLLVGAGLPVAAVLLGSGVLEIKGGSIIVGSAPGPILGVGIGALAVATWYAAVVGIAAAGGDWGLIRGVQFGRSAAGTRLSFALAGLAGGVGVVGFGATAIPIVGPVVAAGVVAVGVAVAGCLIGRTVTTSDLRRESTGTEASTDRLAVPSEGSERIRRGDRDGELVQRDNGGESGPARRATTPRRSRRGRP